MGEIFVSLGLSTASFTKNLDQAKRLAFGSAKEIERSFRLIGTAVATAGVAMATAFAFMVKSQISAAAALHDLSLKTGVSVESLSRLGHAAKLSGVDMDGMAKGLQKLQKAAVEAAQDPKSELAGWFRAFGIDVREAGGHVKNAEQLFLELSDSVRDAATDASKSSLIVTGSIKLMGKAGADNLPLLMEDLRAAGKEFDEFGATISTKFAKDADEFEDNIIRLQAALAGLTNQIAGPAIGGLTDIAEGMRSVAREQGKIAAGGMLLLFPDELREIGRFERAMKGFSEALALPQKEARDAAREAAGEMLAKFAETRAAAVAAAKKHADAIQGIIGKLREQIATFGMSDVAVNVYKAALEGASPAQQNLIHDLGITVQQLEFMRKKLLDVAVVPVFELPAGAEALSEEMEQAALQMAGFAQNTERALEAMRGLAIEMPKIPKPLSEMQENMRIFALRSADALGEWLISGGSFRQVLQGIIQDLARMIFHTLVLRPLMNALFGGGGGGLFGGLFGGGGGGGELSGGAHHTFAHGGMPPVGQFSLVGERGPELFMPKVPGRIVPHSALGGRAGGAGDQIIQIDARGADFGTVAKISALMSRAHSRELLRMMQDRQLRTA